MGATRLGVSGGRGRHRQRVLPTIFGGAIVCNHDGAVGNGFRDDHGVAGRPILYVDRRTPLLVVPGCVSDDTVNPLRADATVGAGLAFASIVTLFTLHTAATPHVGALNPVVTQEVIQKTICIPGWTATIRPSSGYTTALKVRQLKGTRPLANPADYVEDHIIPLGIGGEPRDPKNLVPELIAESRRKDVVESRVHRAVCRGTLSLAEGRAIFRAERWRTVRVP